MHSSVITANKKGDPDATITSEEQQGIAVEAIKEFLATRND